MLLLSRSDIKKVFTMRDAIEADKKAFAMLEGGEVVVPLRTNIQAPAYDGCFLMMPAYSESLAAASLKIIDIFPHNIDMGKISAPAQVMLIDGTTGEIAAILDGNTVTQYRTGAASGAAFDLLAKAECQKGALIGTGGQAACQLEAMLESRHPKQVMIYDLNKDRLNAFVETMNAELASYGAKLIAAGSSDEAIEDADLIITVTPSSTPVFDGNKVKPGATISCVGSYQPHMQEMPPEILVRASKLYFDSQDAVLSEAGDILTPLADGTITEADFTGNLGDVVLGKLKGRENDEEIIVFKTVGVAVQDLVAAKYIFDKATASGIGTSWES